MELIMRPHLREGCSMGETKDRGGRGWGEERKAIVQVCGAHKMRIGIALFIVVPTPTSTSQ